jgi:hypothetical protein
VSANKTKTGANQVQNIEIKILLNKEILSDSQPPQERRFLRVPATYIQPPDSDPKYFETLPTMWAEAYTFQRAIERGDRAAIEEWVSLILLDYFGVLHLKRYEQSTLSQEYDPDLWPSISGTYPSPKGDSVSSLELLHTSSRAAYVVGAVYPGIIFFPGRGRSLWTTDEVLQPYLENQRLSWRKGCEVLLQDNFYRRSFYLHLMSVLNILELAARTALSNFCMQETIFRGLPTTPITVLASNPIDWERPNTIIQNQEDLLERLLRQYPLQKSEPDGSTTYYLVADLPATAEWMRTAIAPGLPAPNQYEFISESKIRVQFAGKEHNLNLGKNQAIKLNTLFLNKEPFYCAVNKSALELRTPQIRKLHKEEILNNTGAFTQIKPDDVAICLFPAKSKLFKHFPEILLDPDKFVSISDRTVAGGLNWQVTLLGRSFVIPTEPKYSKALPDSQLAIWPPEVSPQWNLYAAHGTGAKRESCGRWQLIDETGKTGENVELAKGASDDEYVNILSSDGTPNRPMAMELLMEPMKDGSSNERGILFFTPLKERTGANKAALAVDFGTSNSCLAYKLEGSKPLPLIFTLSPTMLWGEPPLLENPGFIPFKWGGTKGYFPTILFSRKNADFTGVTANNIEARHLFATDIPMLHKEMENIIFNSAPDTWDIHTDLKWHPDPKRPWARPAFLGVLLLYAQAELFFRHQVKINKYVFTFPLAFLDHEQTQFHEQTQSVIGCIRKLGYGTDDGTYTYDDKTDESTAIAKSVDASTNKSVVEVFVDIGGGTTDIAIRYDGKFLVLDSIRMAGKSFFDFADDNFNDTLEVEGKKDFLRHFGKLLLNIEAESHVSEAVNKSKHLGLSTFYSIAINRLDDNEFKKKEAAILQKSMGSPSYQLYRTQLFFRHILTYAMLQACAMVVDQKLTSKILTSGINLILSGNGWGLMVFGEFHRKKEKLKEEVQHILTLLKHQLLKEHSQEEDSEKLQLERACLENLKISVVDLLNEGNLSKAKTDVSVGALLDRGQKQTHKDADNGTHPYAGITMNGIRVTVTGAGNSASEPFAVRWCERWGDATLKRKLNLQRPRLSIESLELNDPESYEVALNHQLSIFTGLEDTNSLDQMPPEEWQKINGLLCQGSTYISGNKLTNSPINYFVSRILYPEDMDHRFLIKLAAINKMVK